MNPVTSAMTAELEQILSIDEECRSRVAFAQKQIERAIEEARAARVRAIDDRQKALSAAIERDLLAIREEGERQMSVRRAALTVPVAAPAAPAPIVAPPPAPADAGPTIDQPRAERPSRLRLRASLGATQWTARA